MNERLHIHKKADSSASFPVQSQFQSRPNITQAQPDSEKRLTQREIENQEFQQQKLEATRLERQAKYGTITPEGQVRLSVLQAKRSDFWQQKHRTAKRYGHNLLNLPIPLYPAKTKTAPPVQPKPNIQKADSFPQKTFIDQKAGTPLQMQPLSMGRLPISEPLVQPKLTIGQPGDKYEQEADRVADQVVNQINAPAPQPEGQSQPVQREAIPEEEDELMMKPLMNTIQREEVPEEDEELQMKPEAGTIQREAMLDEEEFQMKPMVQLQPSEGGMAAAPDPEASIQQARGSGQPLADSIREPMEQAFGADFSGVKVHTDAQSDQLNQSIQARAFTTGQDIFFQQEAYNPGSRGGQELIAHELTHVVQQEPAVQRMAELGKQGGKRRGVTEHNPGGMILQRVVTVDNKEMNADQIWARVVNTQYFQDATNGPDEINIKELARDLLIKWVNAPASSTMPWNTSENRQYQDPEAVARALIGELGAADELQNETERSRKIWESEGVKKILNQFMSKIKTLTEIPNDGRYWWHYGNFLKKNLQSAVQKWDESYSIEATIALILDVGYAMRKKVGNMLRDQKKRSDTLTPEQTAARGGHWNPNEHAEWTKQAREQGRYLSAGPSATMGQTLRLARALNADLMELSTVAQAGAAFWNVAAKRHQSGIHTYHEVMDVFALHAQILQQEQANAQQTA